MCDLFAKTIRFCFAIDESMFNSRTGCSRDAALTLSGISFRNHNASFQTSGPANTRVGGLSEEMVVEGTVPGWESPFSQSRQATVVRTQLQEVGAWGAGYKEKMKVK